MVVASNFSKCNGTRPGLSIQWQLMPLEPVSAGRSIGAAIKGASSPKFGAERPVEAEAIRQRLFRGTNARYGRWDQCALFKRDGPITHIVTSRSTPDQLIRHSLATHDLLLK